MALLIKENAVSVTSL